MPAAVGAVQLFAEVDPSGPPQLVSQEWFDAYVDSLGSVAASPDRTNRTLLLRWHFLPGTPLSSLTWNFVEVLVRAWEKVVEGASPSTATQRHHTY